MMSIDSAVSAIIMAVSATNSPRDILSPGGDALTSNCGWRSGAFICRLVLKLSWEWYDRALPHRGMVLPISMLVGHMILLSWNCLEL